MCTVITYHSKDHYFGRNLDLEYSYQETVTITPRNFPLHFRHVGDLERHYAMIGMAFVAQEYPLYYEASNEKGLSMAGLNFPGNAHYHPQREERDNVTPFELIPWVLGQCADLKQARACLERLNLLDEPFSPELPLTPLHWIVADQTGALTVEPGEHGLDIYENPVGVLTNNPVFPQQMTMLSNYRGLSCEEPENRFCPGIELPLYSRGMGEIGLPGDLSSQSRFVRACFTKLNARSGASEEESVSQFFHILTAVEQQRGCVRMPDGRYEITVYSCCCNVDRGIYYYTTYDNRALTAVHLHHEDLDGTKLVSYSLMKQQRVFDQN